MSEEQKEILTSSSVEQAQQQDPPLPDLTVSKRRGWLQILLSVVILCCGIAIGSAVTLRIQFNLAREGFQRPEDLSRRIVGRIQGQFDLSSEQRERLNEIFRVRLGNIRDLRLEYQPLIHEEMAALRQEVSEVLTPEQAEQWSKRFRGFEHLWLGLPKPMGPGVGNGRRFRGGEGPDGFGGPGKRGRWEEDSIDERSRNEDDSEVTPE